MPDPPAPRSVKIGSDERTGWSSERPRRAGAPPRQADVSVRARVLRPSDRLRYSPGSLLLVVGPVASEPDRFAERVVEERGAVLSLAKVHTLLAGRGPSAPPRGHHCARSRSGSNAAGAVRRERAERGVHAPARRTPGSPRRRSDLP